MPSKKKKTNRRSRLSPQELYRRRMVRRGIISSVAALVVVALIVFFLVLRNSSNISIAENGIGSLFSRAQSGVSTVVGGVRQFASRWRDFDRLQDDYNALQLENQQLSLQLASAREDTQEKENLQELLDAKSVYEALDPIYARVIARAPGQWFETFSINRGSVHGVSTGMAVVNGSGLIGRVYEVGMNYAKVICIIDPRSSVACMVQNTRDNGIMRGQVLSGDNVAQCYVYYLPNLNSVVPGDAGITSGTDELFPKGLCIGTVTAVSMDGGSDGSYAIITPAVDFHHIEEVFVLREVIETASDKALPVVNPTAAPTSSASVARANATPTPTPEPDEPIWTYPSAGVPQLEQLPEDEWAKNTY